MGIDVETRPLYISSKNNLGDKVLGEVEKDSFNALPGKGGHSGRRPTKNMSQPGEIWRGVL